MTEPTLQAIETAATAALAPEAQAILEDLHEFAAREITAFGHKLPTLLGHTDADVRAAVTALHEHITAIATRIDAHLHGRPVDPTQAPPAPTS